jgi:hypothetical protein
MNAASLGRFNAPIKKVCGVLKAHNQVKQALVRATAGQCGMDSSQCHADIVTEAAKLDRPGFGNHGESSEATLFLCGDPPPFRIALRLCQTGAQNFPGVVCLMQGPTVGPGYMGLEDGQDLRMTVSHGKMRRGRKETSST